MASTGVLFLLLFVGCKSEKDQPEQAKPLLGPLGGAITIVDDSSLAFSLEPRGLSINESRAFFRGRAVFRDPWTIAPASANTRDGIGPVFNARSCDACHVRDGKGKPPTAEGGVFTSMLVRISIKGNDPHGAPLPVPAYGDQIQNFSIPDVEAEAQPRVTYITKSGEFEDGNTYELIEPVYSFEDLAFGAFPDDFMFSPRVTPGMTGLGLLQGIPEQDILNNADPEDQDGDGISGKANYVWDAVNQKTSLGRFGWKANQPNLRQQTAGAFLGDIGITSSLFENENCTTFQTNCKDAPTGSEDGKPELIEPIFDDIIAYSSSLAVPAQRGQFDPDVRAGFELFKEAGCQGCHTMTQKTGPNKSPELISDQTFHPFTDLLLHDMGEELADNRPDFLANGREWRTAPLWGLGLLSKINGHTRMLHDGRARNFSEAILWHGGEAEAARQQYKGMTATERDQLIRFLESL
ncbi:MAG: thiol oxidoreductase [Zetaproteobacteria bacterium]|nr:thiol oxidoreductase [Pseudobdellovibrionaceae bacterium]